jgi:hypothetical protein
MNSKLYEQLAIVATVDPVKLSTSGGTASTTSATSDVVDMDVFERVMWILKTNTVAANSGVAMTVYSGTATGTVTTTVKAMTSLVAADDDKQAIVEIDNRDLALGHRYIKAVITVAPTAGTAASATVDLVGLAGGCKYGPANNYDLASVKQIESS